MRTEELFNYIIMTKRCFFKNFITRKEKSCITLTSLTIDNMEDLKVRLFNGNNLTVQFPVCETRKTMF